MTQSKPIPEATEATPSLSPPHKLRSAQRQWGFSLMELLVVVATIGTLAAMLLPALSGAQRRAKLTVCLGNYHQLGIGVELFLEDTHKYPGKLGGHEIAREFACNMTDDQRFREMTNRPLFQYI